MDSIASFPPPLFGPKHSQGARCSSLGVLKLRPREARGKKRKDRTGNLLGIDPGVAMHTFLNPLNEAAPALRPRDAGRRMPALIIEAAQQHGQLRTQINGSSRGRESRSACSVAMKAR